MQVTYAKHRSRLDCVSARKFQETFDVIASEFDVFEYMFDMIVNEVKKYSANAGSSKRKLITN